MIRIGVIGAGPNGTGNAKNLAKHDNRCRIAAVADPNSDAAKKLAQVYGAKAFAGAEELLGEVDAVVVSSPNFLHKEHTVLAAQAGKHVWIEKPMALSVSEADAMVEAVTQAKVTSMIGFSVRFDGITRKMKEVVQAGTLGNLVSLWSRRLSFCDPSKIHGWRLDYARSGGVLAELMVHEIDWILDIAGKPTTIYCRKASRKHTDPRDNEHIWLTLGFGEERTATIEGSQMALIADFYRGIVGSKASLHTRNWGGELHLQTTPDATAKLEALPPFDKHGHFLDVIEGRCSSVADVRYGRTIVKLCETIIESAVSGKALTFREETA
jgi:predicted dehydrogenase